MIPRSYYVRVTTATADLQPEDVQKIIGDEGDRLVGEMIEYEPDFGNRLKYVESFDITGESTEEMKVGATEEDIYKFMVKAFDRITNYGENYVPKVHDPLVLKLASEEFGINEERANKIYIKKELEKANY